MCWLKLKNLSKDTTRNFIYYLFIPFIILIKFEWYFLWYLLLVSFFLYFYSCPLISLTRRTVIYFKLTVAFETLKYLKSFSKYKVMCLFIVCILTPALYTTTPSAYIYPWIWCRDVRKKIVV